MSGIIRNSTVLSCYTACSATRAIIHIWNLLPQSLHWAIQLVVYTFLIAVIAGVILILIFIKYSSAPVLSIRVEMTAFRAANVLLETLNIEWTYLASVYRETVSHFDPSLIIVQRTVMKRIGFWKNTIVVSLFRLSQLQSCNFDLFLSKLRNY